MSGGMESMREDEWQEINIDGLERVTSGKTIATNEPFADKVKSITESIYNVLVEKNQKYGNSALQPKRIFSKADSVEQLKVRIDDKLSRIANIGHEASDEDTLTDLIGYLVLLKVALGDLKNGVI